jgi:glycosyltransferase involved in cell wall biosynthesis
MLDICFVHLKPVPPRKGDFATIVPLRMAKVLGSRAQLHVIYMGTINEGKLRKAGIRTYRYSGTLARNRWTRYFGLAKFVADVVQSEEVDVLQNVWFHYGLFPLKVAGLLTGVPILARIAGEPISIAETSNPLRWVRNRLGLAVEHVALTLADHVHVLSTDLRDTFRSRGVASEKMSTASQGCDITEFSPPKEGEEHFEATDCSGDDQECEEFRLLYVGRITPNKGLDELMEAFRRVAETEALRITLDVVGEGSPDVIRKYRSWLDQWGLEDHSRFRGYVENDHLCHIYQDVDVFVLPSHREGLPNVILEAMASGTVCIGTRVGAIPELLGSGRGVIVPPKRPDCLASAIRNLIHEGDQATEMARQAREYVVRHHSFRAVREKYLDMYTRLGSEIQRPKSK